MGYKGLLYYRILKWFYLASFLAIYPASSAQTQNYTAKGSVFLDSNKNGIYDTNEKGIEGVKISNSRDVVKTDGEGRYTIKLPPNTTLFLSKPAGYTTPLNEVQLPQFYYHFYPDGTPDVAVWKWPVIAPTGPLPKSIDFPLIDENMTDKFKAMGFADPQTSNDEELDMLRKDVLDDLFGNPYQAKFGLVAGDVVNDNLALYDRHNKLMSQIGIPIWNVPGNHDLNTESPNYLFASQTYKSVFGPDYYSFEYGAAHFLALNNVGFRGKGKGYTGKIDEKQLEWIENDLRDVPDDKLIVIITHIPLLTYADNRTFPPGTNTSNFEQLLKILQRFKYIYAMAGHDTSNSWKVEVNHEHGWHGRPFIAHTLAEVRGNGWNKGPRDERGVRQATMQDGNPNGYYVVHFNGPSVRPQFIPASGDPADRLRIVLDPPLQSPGNDSSALDRGSQPDSLFLVVNFFDGGERDRVTISLNKMPALEMENVERTDPHMEKLFLQYDKTDDAFGSPVVSSHVWQFLLPKLKPGLHVALVRAVDEFGFEDSEVFTFEITE